MPAGVWNLIGPNEGNKEEVRRDKDIFRQYKDIFRQIDPASPFGHIVNTHGLRCRRDGSRFARRRRVFAARARASRRSGAAAEICGPFQRSILTIGQPASNCHTVSLSVKRWGDAENFRQHSVT
jgi:hypothetical protein